MYDEKAAASGALSEIPGGDEFLESLLTSYNDSIYPEGFSEKYHLMECLSEGPGIITFMVQDGDGRKYIAKCYDRSEWSDRADHDILKTISGKGVPEYVEEFENADMTVTVRTFAEGVSLDRYCAETYPDREEVVRICLQICEILACLHHRKDPVIHRDIKPQNIIIGADGNVTLIDFDTARIYKIGNETDTVFFGTPAYAPPEQFGFSQTDARADIYSFGILLRWMITGSTKENLNIRTYRPLEEIIRKCTCFAPEDRFSDIDQVKKALLAANPVAQRKKWGGRILCALLCAGLLIFGGIKIYRTVTYTPFTEDAVPAFENNKERIDDAVSYMKEKYHTELFTASDDIATIGTLRAILIELYGYDRDYIYAINDDMPMESEEYFLPWGWDDGQNLDRDICIYAAVKAHDPAITSDWSAIKDDNGFYPGVRAAVAFSDQYGIAEGANRPGDITVGEAAVIFANADRVFAAAGDKLQQ